MNSSDISNYGALLDWNPTILETVVAPGADGIVIVANRYINGAASKALEGRVKALEAPVQVLETSKEKKAEVEIIPPISSAPVVSSVSQVNDSTKRRIVFVDARSLREGQKVEYLESPGPRRKGPEATEVAILF